MKNKHPKLKTAKKMLTKKEREKGVPPFQSNAWNQRSEAIKKRLTKKKL